MFLFAAVILGTALGAEAPAELPVFAWEHLRVLAALILFGAFFFYFTRTGRKGDGFLRKLPGVEAIEEAIGRATEMGRPVMYVPGTERHTDFQTIASMLILGEVAKTSAEYGVRMIVPTRYPVVMTMAQEIMREAGAAQGRPDLFLKDDVRYLSDELFAFCAGVDGIILREKPAANLFLGTFYAESLILAETGLSSGAIQIAGTASVTQVPFFIVACDYTLIGEEFYAASAYLSRERQAVAGIKTADWVKAVLIGYCAGGLVLAALSQADAPSIARAASAVLEYYRHPENLVEQFLP
jgi:hypothetical protein